MKDKSEITDLLMDAIYNMEPAPLLDLLTSVDGVIDWEMLSYRIGDLVERETIFDGVDTPEAAASAVLKINKA